MLLPNLSGLSHKSPDVDAFLNDVSALTLDTDMKRGAQALTEEQKKRDEQLKSDEAFLERQQKGRGRFPRKRKT